MRAVNFIEIIIVKIQAQTKKSRAEVKGDGNLGFFPPIAFNWILDNFIF